jgi:succinate dehydrogenase hydrophobic anchor subunit
MFSTLNMRFTAVVLVVVAIAAISAILEIAVINGSQAQLLQKTPPTTLHHPFRLLFLLPIPLYHQN